MPHLKTNNVLISHAWQYNEEYYQLESMLIGANNFKWRNFSVPTHDPLVPPNTQFVSNKLPQLLDNQIRHVNCVLLLASMDAHYIIWINKKI